MNINRQTYYQKNKDKWKIYYQNQLNDPVKHKLRIRRTKQWKKDNPLKNKSQKRKSDAKYHNKMKNDPVYRQKRIDYARMYNNKPEVKEHRKRINAIRRSKPEVKKKNAEYNKRYHEQNPDVVLRNIRKHLRKLALSHNMVWYKLEKQLRGWAKIIHNDYNQTCAVCNKPSEEAHHILHKSKYPELAFNRNNGIALCQRCHNQVHGKQLMVGI